MDLLDFRDHYPNHPGFRDTDTSREAAERVAGRAGAIRGRVLAAIREAGASGLTTNECVERLGIDRDTLQPRTSELRATGEIVDSGMRRHNGNGRKAIVWRAA